MRRGWVLSAIFLSISTAWSANKDEVSFKPGPASSYATQQTQDKVTIAAIPYVNDDELKTAFGKDNPYKYGILPVLVVIQNESGNLVAFLKRPASRGQVDYAGSHPRLWEDDEMDVVMDEREEH